MAADIRQLAAVPGEIILVCRKCQKKLGGGFGPEGDERLSKILRHRLGAARKLGKKKQRAAPVLIETGCLGLCPKGAVAVATAGRLLLVSPGTPARDVIAALGLRPVSDA